VIESVQKGRSPFCIEGPALISFSGGRTSAYMLRRILDEGLQPDVHIVFADTGRERPETYEFVTRCAEEWGVEVHWVHRPGYFDQLIVDKQALPNTVQRFCTQELKLKPMWAFARSLGWEHWECAVGIRADEPRRIAKIRGRKPDDKGQETLLPLADAGIGLEEVTAFWQAQSFDLQLQPWEGNCDLCFLKAQGKRIRIMQDQPDLAQWWIEKERETGRSFRAAPRPSYTQLLQVAQMPMLFDPAEEDLTDCVCGD
jgi:3'-phosphoadenosine 5'-phosphosulfate sulfotransferase (PAPS reductase)/FAD synthetase